MQAEAGAVVDHKINGYQMLIVALCGVVALFDGYDTQAVAFVAPLMATEWHAPLSAFGAIFSSALLGGLVGAVILGVAADIAGRRLAIAVSVAIFAIGSLVSVLARSPIDMIPCRLLTGFGLGGAIPSVIALAGEYSPRKHSATIVTAMFCGFPFGAVVGAVATAPLIEAYGWRSVFWVGGLGPLVFLPIFLIAAPESIAWLVKRGRTDKVQAIRARLPAEAGSHPMSAEGGKVSLKVVFGERRGIGAALMGLVFFLSLLMVYLLVSWVPTIATEAGYSARQAVMSAAILNMASVVGSLLIARANDRLDPYWVVAGVYAAGAVIALAFAITGRMGALIFPFSVLAGLFCVGAQVSLIAVGAAFFPIEVRGSGLGFLLAAGRAGAIVGPLLGAALIGRAHVPTSLSACVAAFALAASVALLLARQSRPALGKPAA